MTLLSLNAALALSVGTKAKAQGSERYSDTWLIVECIYVDPGVREWTLHYLESDGRIETTDCGEDTARLREKCAHYGAPPEAPIWLPVEVSFAGPGTALADDEKLKDLLLGALLQDTLRHKQWYVWKLAEHLGFDPSVTSADPGMAP